MRYQVLIIFVFFLFSCNKQDQDPPKNVLIICIDDLRPELKSFGANYIKSPNIDALANKGVKFTNHFVNAPSCGPSRYTLLTGQYGLQYRKQSNGALFARAEDELTNAKKVSPSMPEWFKLNGYTTVSVGKVSHHPGGRGGTNWDTDSIIEMPGAWDKHLMPVGSWKTPRGAMHGLANGQARTPDHRAVMESVDGLDTSYPDGLIAEEGLNQIEKLAAAKTPFFLAIGLIKPHLPFGVPKKYLDMYEGAEIPEIQHPEKPQGKTTWHPSGEFMKYNRNNKDPRTDNEFAMELKRYYAACVSYADKHVGDILKKLKETGADKNTIVVLWGDHGWHLGEHAIWGKHSLFEESLHSPLIIYNPEMKENGQGIDAIVETLDVFPTLAELCKLPNPDFVQGKSLVPVIENKEETSRAAIAYTAKATTIRTSKYRFIEAASGSMELYDHVNNPDETKNIAKENPAVVKELKKLLNDKIGGVLYWSF
ncbi:sulfatase [Algibacter amylolyticus]|uniref:Sulfatase n=1 Tax=Algibacter amylolyticus TaxID=1608400 RepID=A0A5M7BA45_9FLAO|nr:sulfatase [Algibacter amylolyticus]KAA5825188.1 sulfatase [Algibacter amylolyticus]MBB5268695.1 iduronate 2-sulfatase [Algibacter amylolyticus]TSJ77682.1 sulfatase [Algibacter amylolyticus]